MMNSFTEFPTYVATAYEEQEAEAHFDAWIEFVDAQVERRDDMLEAFDSGDDSTDIVLDDCVLSNSRIAWQYLGHGYVTIITNKEVVYLTDDKNKAHELLSELLDTWLAGGYHYRELGSHAARFIANDFCNAELPY